MDTPPGPRPLTDNQSGRVKGGDKCFYCMTPKAPLSTPKAYPSNVDAGVQNIPSHVTAGFPLFLGNPSCYGMVRLRLKALQVMYCNRSSTSGKSTKSSNPSGQSGHFILPSRRNNVSSYGSKTVSAVTSATPTESTMKKNGGPSLFSSHPQKSSSTCCNL